MINTNKHAINNAMPFLMACLVCSCFLSPSQKHSVQKINLIYKLPILKENGELINVKDSLEIYYYNKQFLIQIPYIYSLENSKEILKKETRFNYFFYLKDSDSGFYFDSHKGVQPKKLPVDSFMITKTFKNINFYDQNNDSLLLTIKSLTNETLLEKYVPKKKFDQSYPDTIYLYYSKKFNNIDLYSFSKTLDSSRKMKLFKVEMKYNSQFYEGYKFKFPQREFFFQLKESQKSGREIIDLFKTFKGKLTHIQ